MLTLTSVTEGRRLLVQQTLPIVEEHNIQK
jgi:hypothetical protein